MRIFLFILCLVFASATPARTEEEAVAAFLDAVSTIKALQGRFVQQQFDQADVSMGESRGAFKLLRPSYFLWDIESPDRQQVIAGPEYVWHYDRDLQTATRRPVNDSSDMAPLQILGGDEALLRERFLIEQAGDDRFLLRPQQPGSGFEQVVVSLVDGKLASMEILDQLQQRLLVTFSDVNADVELAPVDFSFSPPGGADTFYYDE